MNQRDHDARAAGTNRVPQGAGAAIDVDLVVRHVQIIHQRHGNDGKSFVDFPQVHVIDLPAGFVQGFL